MMSSPPAEAGRDVDGSEDPQHQVTIAYSFAVGKYEVTRDEYARFIKETGLADPAGCNIHQAIGPHWPTIKGLNWHNTGFSQTGRDPAVCMSWNETQAYVAWLSRKTGKNYRLFSEAEWEYAARAGTTTAALGRQAGGCLRLRQCVRYDAKGKVPLMGCRSTLPRRFRRDRPGRQLQAERLRALRHDGKCFRDDCRLSQFELSARSGGRFAMDHRRLQESRQSWRFLDLDTGRAALGGSRLRRHRHDPSGGSRIPHCARALSGNISRSSRSSALRRNCRLAACLPRRRYPSVRVDPTHDDGGATEPCAVPVTIGHLEIILPNLISGLLTGPTCRTESRSTTPGELDRLKSLAILFRENT
jgi:sulfatase-modifying factor enzyme 1